MNIEVTQKADGWMLGTIEGGYEWQAKGESNLEYLQISQELDDLLRPVFRFTDKGEARAVTIPDLAFNIVDKVLHATFTLAFRDSIEEPEAPPLMAELESNIRTNRKE